MAVAIIQEWRDAGHGTGNYDAISERLVADGNHEPDGLLAHTAGFDGDTFRIFEVWESQGHYDRFRDEKLMPTVQAAAQSDAEPPDQRAYELHGFHRPAA